MKKNKNRPQSWKINKRKRNRGRLKRPGLPPGSIIHVGERFHEQSKIEINSYSPSAQTTECIVPDQDLPRLKKEEIHWVNVMGVSDIESIVRLGENHGINPLMLEDIVNTEQMPKAEVIDNGLFVVTKMITLDTEKHQLVSEQVSFLLKDNLVFSFQERQGDIFDPIRKRLENQASPIRNRDVSFLLYALVDAVVDHYAAVMDQLADDLDDIEEKILTEPSQNLLMELHAARKEIALLSKTIRPTQEMAKFLIKNEDELIDKKTEAFFNDVYDHCREASEAIDSYREMTAQLMDLYLSLISNGMNQVMKTLTIIASVFIPLTFIVGIYGMNFENMPELSHPMGYPAIWAVMITSAISTLIFFRFKKWL